MAGKRTDAHHAYIRDALRAAGVLVFDTSAVGHGYPDLVCGYQGRIIMLEIKEPAGRLTPAQIEFFERWQGYPVYVVRNLEDAMRIICEGQNSDAKQL